MRYPSELDDELITSHCYGVPSTSLGPSCDNADFSWLRGWNFTTDLYRVLEHIINSNRRRLHPVERDPVSPLFGPTPVCELVVMENVLSMYSALPSRFRETPPITGDMTRDLFGFQSANIHATMQLLRMVLLSTEKAGVDRRCDVAEEMLKVFSKMPIEYLKTINLPLVGVFFPFRAPQIVLIICSSITLAASALFWDPLWNTTCPRPPTNVPVR